MTNGEKFLIGIVILVILVIGAFFGYRTIKKNITEKYSNKSNETNSSAFDKYESNTVNEEITDTSNKNVISNNTENETIENTVKEEKKESQEQVMGKEEEETAKEISNTISSSEQITESKALDLVKETWGNDESVYYTIASKDDQNYYVSVNDISSTSVLAWYSVNIQTGEVKEN